MRKLLACIIPILLFTCFGCADSTLETMITDGAEAATVAAVLTLETTLPLEAPLIIKGLNGVSATAIKILQFPADTLTLQELINLAMVDDPNIERYRAIINFVLPILDDVPGVSKFINTPINAIPSNIRAYMVAFFTGIQRGLGHPSGTTLQDVLLEHPSLNAAVKRMDMGKFDVNALANALQGKTAACRDGKCLRVGGNCATCARQKFSLNLAESVGEWDSDGDGHGQGSYRK